MEVKKRKKKRTLDVHLPNALSGDNWQPIFWCFEAIFGCFETIFWCFEAIFGRFEAIFACFRGPAIGKGRQFSDSWEPPEHFFRVFFIIVLIQPSGV
jgi:hypothetical protein